MKNLLILITIFICGCASKNRYKKISNATHDTFSQESFLRYDMKRLASENNSKSCFAGEINDTLGELREQIDKNKKDARYWNKIGTCYYLDQNYAKAEYYYQISLQSEKNNTGNVYYPALNNIGLIKIRLHHYQQALNYFKKASKNNHYLTPKYNLSQMLLTLYHPREAISILSLLYKKNKKDNDINFSLSYAYLQLGKLDLALKYLHASTSQHRDDISLIKSIILFEKKEYQSALEILGKSNNEEKNIIKYHHFLQEIIELKIDELEETQEKS